MDANATSSPTPTTTASIQTTTVNVVKAASTTTPNDMSSVATNASYGVTGLVVLVAVFLVLILIKRRCVKKSDTRSVSSGEVTPGPDVFTLENELFAGIFERTQPMYWYNLDETLRKLVKGLIIDSRRLEFGKELGRGQFGCVYEAALNREARTSNDYGNVSHERVAVKTLRGGELDVPTVEAFLKEGLIMRDFIHKNVLTLIGVALADGGVPMIVLPFMSHGNLKGYIGKANLVITVRELLGFGLQIAEGMHYLSSHKFVHRDLAARNCMLNEDMIVKVADFGLSRDIYTKDYYTSSDKFAKLPVKWMAIESLTKSVYTTKSDVWSFGVLLWELLTRGATPYPDVSNWEIRNYIQSGRRMQQPDTCPDEIHELMLQCWSERPEDRPNFETLKLLLADVLHPVPQQRPSRKEEPAYINLFQQVDVPTTPLEDLPDPFSP